MYCKICGDEKTANWRNKSAMTLCDYCASTTPAKVEFSKFCAVYFKGDEDCPRAIKREFFDDYKTSSHNLKEYMAATISAII